MANHKATKKSIVQTQIKTLRNRSIKSKIRTFMRRLEEALAKKEFEASKSEFQNVQKHLMKAVSKGVFKLTTASRKLSRLNSKVKSLKN